jgi:predicted Zn-ribbon and HTH transcriptional regulator
MARRKFCESCGHCWIDYAEKQTECPVCKSKRITG